MPSRSWRVVNDRPYKNYPHGANLCVRPFFFFLTQNFPKPFTNRPAIFSFVSAFGGIVVQEY